MINLFDSVPAGSIIKYPTIEAHNGITIYFILLLIFLLLIGASISMKAVLLVMVISNLNIYITNALLVQHYIKYRLLLQIKDIIPTYICTLITGGIVYFISIHIYIHWILLSTIFLILYLTICYVFIISAMVGFKGIINNLLRKLSDD